MAWIRTALSMIDSVSRFTSSSNTRRKEIAAGNIRRYRRRPRNLSVFELDWAVAPVALTAAAWQHRVFLTKIGASRGRHVWSVSFCGSALRHPDWIAPRSTVCCCDTGRFSDLDYPSRLLAGEAYCHNFTGVWIRG